MGALETAEPILRNEDLLYSSWANVFGRGLLLGMTSLNRPVTFDQKTFGNTGADRPISML